MGQNLKRHLTKEYIHMTSKHMKRYSTLYVIIQIQTKTTVRYSIYLLDGQSLEHW